MSKGTVLIVQDGATQRARLASILQQAGLQVTQAEGAENALEVARSTLPQVIVSDVALSGADGFSLCRLVRADKALAGVSVLLLTGLSDPEDVVWALESGANGFLLKPFADDELVARVEFLMANPKSGAALEDALAISFLGRQHLVCSSRQQILSLLLSTFESAARNYKQNNKETLALKMRIRELERQSGPESSEAGAGQAVTDMGLGGDAIKNLVRLLPCPVLVVSPDGDIIQVGSSWAEEIGGIPKEATGGPSEWAGVLVKGRSQVDYDLLVQNCYWDDKEAYLILGRPNSTEQVPAWLASWRIRQELGSGILNSLSGQHRNLLRSIRTGLTTLSAGNEDSVKKIELLLSQLESYDLFAMDAGVLLAKSANFQLAPVLQEIIDTFPVKQSVTQKSLNVSVECPADVTILADARLIRLAVTELLKNACSASQPGGRIYLQVKRSPTELAIGVRDEGSGIPKEMQEQAKGRFFSTWTGHLGLGLYLVDCSCAAHGGKMEISNEEVGTQVCIILPTN